MSKYSVAIWIQLEVTYRAASMVRCKVNHHIVAGLDVSGLSHWQNCMILLTRKGGACLSLFHDNTDICFLLFRKYRLISLLLHALVKSLSLACSG